jgi:hypothetical protein
MLAAPSAAHAEGFVSPGLGVAFGNGAAAGRANFVLDVGWVSREPLGVELDTTIAPDFFDNQGASNGITTVMGNVMILGGRSGRYGRRFRGGGAGMPRVYLSGGFGLMHASTGGVSNDNLGANLGLGFMVVSRQQVGVRGDVRYFRDLVGTSGDSGSNIDFGSFHFWRASLGFVLAF